MSISPSRSRVCFTSPSMSSTLDASATAISIGDIFRRQFLLQRAQAILAPRRRHHARAFTGEQYRRLAPDAAGGAYYKYHLVRQFHSHA